jgi:PKD repeat protein
MPKSDFYINDSLQFITDNKFLFINRSTVPNNPDSNATWYIGDSLMSINQNVRHTYQNSGVYTVKLISSTEYGCKDSISKIVVVAPLTKGIEYDSVVTKKGYDTQLNARKFEGATYLWTPSFLINSDKVINPDFNDTSSERSRQYRIRIIDQYGCVFL